MSLQGEVTFDKEDPGLHPDSCMWLGLGNKGILVKVRERMWFRFKDKGAPVA